MKKQKKQRPVVKFRHQTPIRAILFDLDGVLVNSYEAWFRLFNDTLNHFGYRIITRKEFQREWGKSTKEDVKYFMPGQTIQAVRRYYSQRFPRYIRFVKVTPDAKKVLSKLKKEGYLLGCVTNSHRDITRQMIQKTGIKKYFKVIVCADEVKKPKPAPDMLFKAMRRLKVKPDEVIFIGDTPTDLMAGIRAKCLTFGYKINAKYQIKSLKELLDQYNFFT